MKLQKKGNIGRDGDAATVACRNMENHRNRFIRFRLYLGMRFFLALAVVLIPMQAMSLKDFNAKPAAEQSAYVATCIDRIATSASERSTKLAADIRDYFTLKPAGKPVSEGIEKLYVELTANELRAKDGKADLSAIQIESVIMWVVKQKFPPPLKSGEIHR